jgi:hypothetical protein
MGGNCDAAMPRAPRDPWYGGHGMCLRCGRDRRVFGLASGDARKRVGGKLALVFPGERGTPFSGAGRKRSQRSTPHPVFRHSVHPLPYCMGLYGIARPMTLCRGRSHGPSAKSLAADVNDRKLCFMLQSKKSARSAGTRAHHHQRCRTACCSDGRWARRRT